VSGDVNLILFTLFGRLFVKIFPVSYLSNPVEPLRTVAFRGDAWHGLCGADGIPDAHQPARIANVIAGNFLSYLTLSFGKFKHEMQHVSRIPEILPKEHPVHESV
jgi:hypothetical protein